jgi:WD40 repeat protein
VQAACFSPNSHRFYTGDQFTVRVWDVVTGEQQFEQVAAHRDSISFVAITPNSETLITASKRQLNS